jgi:hypothetical protein
MINTAEENLHQSDNKAGHFHRQRLYAEDKNVIHFSRIFKYP